MTVDVLRYAAFTDDPASGNPAGVVVGAGQLAEPDMLGIAAEVGYSETAFVTGADPRRGRYAVRYFSPRAEVPFCGHATIATAVEIARRAGAGSLVFSTRAGEVPVQTVIRDGRRWATLTSVPGPARRVISTAVAMVACPQNGTSARGLKYRSVYRPRWGSDPVTNAVSE